ncbi:hypothetical protein ABVK25_002375 [Lepraria finkii]|uniref:Uncharacterized protein n=1 Tax=Lepraria finkii TaxID=1340010 RepID=A0ABR4BHL6_9LECA
MPVYSQTHSIAVIPPFKTIFLTLIRLQLYAFVLTAIRPALRPGLLLRSSTFLNLTLSNNPHDDLTSSNVKPLPPAPFDLHFTGGIVKIIEFIIPFPHPTQSAFYARPSSIPQGTGRKNGMREGRRNILKVPYRRIWIWIWI